MDMIKYHAYILIIRFIIIDGYMISNVFTIKTVINELILKTVHFRNCFCYLGGMNLIEY
jgi:hypothetical protein